MCVSAWVFVCVGGTDWPLFAARGKLRFGLNGVGELLKDS